MKRRLLKKEEYQEVVLLHNIVLFIYICTADVQSKVMSDNTFFGDVLCRKCPGGILSLFCQQHAPALAGELDYNTLPSPRTSCRELKKKKKRRRCLEN